MRFVVAAAILLLSVPAGATIMISEVVEGSGTSSKNQAIELYNLGSTAIDLSSWTIDLYLDGSPVPSKSIALSGTILPGDTFVIVRDKADPALLALADLISSQLKFDGNDAIVLRDGPDPILDAVDHIGQVGYDPITEWGSGLTSTRDNTLVRDPSVTSPDPNIFAPFDPSLEWIGYPRDFIGDLGVPPMPVPEPPPWVLLLSGLIYLAVQRRQPGYSSPALATDKAGSIDNPISAANPRSLS